MSSSAAGLISVDVVRRLVCDAELVVALDDALGHTLYEGRARRDPSATQRREVWRRDRHCIFPGCAHVLFTECHHLEAWHAGGPTDLGNLALLCTHHHHLIHTKVWSMSGDANVEVRFVGPTGQVMTTRPSRLWTQVSDPEVLARRRRGAGRGETAPGAGGAGGAGGAAGLTGRAALTVRPARGPTSWTQKVEAGIQEGRGMARGRSGRRSLGIRNDQRRPGVDARPGGGRNPAAQRWLEFESERRQGPDRPPDFSQRARCSIVIVRSDDLHMS